MITVTRNTFRLAQAFTISRGSRTEAKVITVEVARDGKVGRGECVPYARYGESL
ncbi:MAG: dipeptide epimerase, partial [Pseudomonadota bacterium]